MHDASNLLWGERETSPDVAGGHASLAGAVHLQVASHISALLVHEPECACCFIEADWRAFRCVGRSPRRA
eukprot:6435588-Lingulodinium_polyedra.AAC.1